MRLAPLLLLLLAAAPQEAGSGVTFTKDVAPIVFANCAACHRDGEVAPFPLLQYADVKKRAKQILASVESKQMPPWKPVEGWGEFQGERRMKPGDIATLKKWVDQGCVEGDAKDLPAPPAVNDGWAFGEPDLVVKMSEPITVPAEGQEIFRAFVMPLGLTEDRYVRAVQLRPSNKRVVHHALRFLDITGESRRRDQLDPGPGFAAEKLTFGSVSGGSLGAYTPGGLQQPYPEGMGKLVTKTSDFVVQMHFNPIGKEVTEQSQVGFWFMKERPKQSVLLMPLATWHLDLPAGEKDIKVEQKIVLPADVDLFGIIPHAHFLGRECEVRVKDPEGKEILLVRIADWNFALQEHYRYRQPIHLPKGSEFHLVWTFDNSASNPRNPWSPPRRMKWGELSTDEMGVAFLEMGAKGLRDQFAIYVAFVGPRSQK